MRLPFRKFNPIIPKRINIINIITSSYKAFGRDLIMQFIANFKPSFFEITRKGLRTLSVRKTLNLDRLYSPSSI